MEKQDSSSCKFSIFYQFKLLEDRKPVVKIHTRKYISFCSFFPEYSETFLI